jgi:type IV pilus assembly protein PilX
MTPHSPSTFRQFMRPTVKHQRGASLILVLLILVVASLLGVGAAQIALMSERGSRNDRDLQVAWQSAEAVILDAECDILDPERMKSAPDVTKYNCPKSDRMSLFDGKSLAPFIDGCGASGDKSQGLCAAVAAGRPAWMTVNFLDTTTNAPTTPYGLFTGRVFAAGVGLQPARPPRYVVEVVPDTIGDKADPAYLYRVTGMGFGPRTDIQAVLQILYRI